MRRRPRRHNASAPDPRRYRDMTKRALPNILVISPSGEVYDHNRVRWYTDVAASIDQYHNIGDAFVFDSSLKLLSFDRLDVCDIRTVRASDIDRYNAEYDYVFLRGSNYIHAEMDWENAVEVLTRLKIPVLAFGVGAQAPAKGKLQLSASGQRLWQIIGDHATTLGVRGSYTAETLWDMGIHNLRIIGCPTAFRNNNPALRIDLPPTDRLRQLGFTVRREVSPAYSPDITKYLAQHRDIITALVRRFALRLITQGEIEEKKLACGTAKQKQEAWARLKQDTLCAQWYFDREVEELYRNTLFYSETVDAYESLVRGLDLVLGFRLHGNLMALANAVPAIFFVYDSRTAEFAETFAIPSYDVYGSNKFALEDYLYQSRFERFNRAYSMRYREMQDFLNENAIPHLMKPAQHDAAPPAEKAA
jgi:hypothetical protein